MRIAFIGKICSGKSYAAKYLQDNHDFELLSFGEPVKRYATEIFNLKFKDRQIIQDFAQNIKNIDPDVWVNYLIRKLNMIDDSKNIVIDDLRFHNEQYALRKLGFKFIYLYIDDNFQLKRIKETYKTDASKHIQRRYDISECNIDQLDNDYSININSTTQHKLTALLESIINTY